MYNQCLDSRIQNIDRKIKKMQQGDVIVVKELSSLGSTVEEVLDKIEFLLSKNCLIKILNFGVIERNAVGLENFERLEKLLKVRGLDFSPSPASAAEAESQQEKRTFNKLIGQIYNC